MIGRVLNGRYSLISLLGEGGMAVVYRGEDQLLGRQVAVKVLREQFASDKGFLVRFQREARASAGLSHPNIVTVYDVGSDQGTQYIVMELVEGPSLKEIIQQQGPLGSARIIELGRQLCEGLAYAHEHGIVHRDVKPHNILVTPDGRAKIADFGIALAIGGSSLTQSGYVVGSAHYISPEQASGTPTTAYSDLYSAGVTLYEMATARLPFEGETSVVVALKHIQEQPTPPKRWNPRIPESLQSVILQAMAKKPEERYDSGTEMAEALESCARLSLEATQAQLLPARKGARGEASTTPAAAPAGAGKRRSGSWMVLMVVFAAFLCTLGSIPLGIIAFSGGNLGRLIPGVGGPAIPTATSTVEALPSPTTLATATVTPTPTPTPVPIKVPKLTGVPFPSAQQMAQAAGLDVVIAGSAYDPQVPVTFVISQKPAPDSPVEKGARIEVTVSLGREIISVPKVVGDNSAVAQARLAAAGFLPRVTEEWNERVGVGLVISQSPAPDARADRGSEIFIVVSRGKEQAEVPNVVGMPEAEAQDVIVKAGFSRTWPNYQQYTTVPPGYVISQDPKPGTWIEKGATIYIAVRQPQPTAQPTPPGKKKD